MEAMEYTSKWHFIQLDFFNLSLCVGKMWGNLELDSQGNLYDTEMKFVLLSMEIPQKYKAIVLLVFHGSSHEWPLSLTWFNFNPSRDK